MVSDSRLDLSGYRKLLLSISNYLAQYSEKRWSERLLAWEHESADLQADRLREHLQRTEKALWGMGSIGDVVISRSGNED